MKIFKQLQQKAAFLPLMLTLIFWTACQPQPPVYESLEAFLEAQNDLKYREIESDSLFAENFEISLEQVWDAGADTGKFNQRIYVSRKGFDRPTVIITEGYTAHNFYLSELAKLLDANQIIVEHRYFGESCPDTMDWNLLNIRNAAHDHHRIIELFKQIYKEKWVSTGISKGGQTTNFHRFFYPNDVAVSVPYVAPLNYSDKEERVFEFLANVGDSACRAAIYDFQRALLTRKTEILPQFETYTQLQSYEFSIGAEAAYEYAVLEFPFASWQWAYLDCNDIPKSNAPALQMVEFLDKADAISFFADHSMEAYQAFFYQALTEIGFYTYDIQPFADLLTVVEQPDFSMSAPPGVELTYKADDMFEIDKFLKNKANNMLYIYGEYDPWTFAAVVPDTTKTNSLKIVKPQGSHRTRIKNLPDYQAKRVADSLSQWLGDSAAIKNLGLLKK